MTAAQTASQVALEHVDTAHETVGGLAQGQHVDLLESLLGSEDAGRLMQQAIAVAQGGAAAVKELVGVVDYEGIDSAVHEAQSSGQEPSSVSADVTGLTDLSRLQSATGKVEAAVDAFSDLVSTLEGVLAREDVVGRLKDELSQRGEGEADISLVRQAITENVNPEHIGAVHSIKGMAEHLESSSQGCPPEIREQLEHIEATLDSLVPRIQDAVTRLVQAVDGALAQLA